MSAPLHLTLEGCEDDACERHRPWRAGGLRITRAVQMAIVVWAVGMLPYVPGMLSDLFHAQWRGPYSTADFIVGDAHLIRISVVTPEEIGKGAPPDQADPVVMQWPFQYSSKWPTITWRLSIRHSGLIDTFGNRKNLMKEFWRVVHAGIVGDGHGYDAGCYWSPGFYLTNEVGGNTFSVGYFENNSIVTPPESFTRWAGGEGLEKTWAVRIVKRQLTVEGDLPDVSRKFWQALAATMPPCEPPPTGEGHSARLEE